MIVNREGLRQLEADRIAGDTEGQHILEALIGRTIIRIDGAARWFGRPRYLLSESIVLAFDDGTQLEIPRLMSTVRGPAVEGLDLG